MTSVLITGGAGFIGSHLSRRLLAAGHSLRILDNLSPQIHGSLPRGLDWLRDSRIEFIRGSVTRRDDVREALAGVEVVVHLAAETGTGQSMYRIAHYNDVNVGGTAMLLDVLANDPDRSVRRIVLASSRSVYGEGAYRCGACQPARRVHPSGRPRAQLAAHRWNHACATCGRDLEPLPTLESDAVSPASIYAATKYAQEDLVRVGCSALGIDHAILRLQNVYGEGQSLQNPYTGILSIFSNRIRLGQHLPIFEDGLETRDFVHVDDVASAFHAAIGNDAALDTVVNVGSGTGTAVLEVASLLCDAFGAERNMVVTREYRLGDIRHNSADTGRLRSLLGCEPQVALAEGLRRFAEWVNRQESHADLSEQASREMRGRKLMG